MRKVYNVGINDYNGRICINNKKIKSYQSWKDMLARCYSYSFHNKNPTYIGCTVCDDWLYFSKFKEWFDKNYRWDLDEQGIKLNLDKDLLSGESKIYSPETCVFLPKKINLFIANIQNNNVSGYTGVCWHKNNKKWVSRIHDFFTSKNKYVGQFNNIEDARDAYIEARKIEVLKVKEYLRELGYDKKIIDNIK